MGLNKEILFDQFNQSSSEEASFRRMERRDDGHGVERQTIFGLRLHSADPDGSRRRPVARPFKLRWLVEIILTIVEPVGALRCSERSLLNPSAHCACSGAKRSRLRLSYAQM